MHPVGDVGISPWPVDVVEFGVDAYAHRKQVGVKQLYNQVPQTAWVSWSSSCSSSWRKVPEWEPVPDRGLGSLGPTGAAQPECKRSAAMVRGTWGRYVAVCLHLQLTSHTQETPTLLNKVWEVYLYKEVCSFVNWSHHYVSAYICMYMSI